MRYVSLIVVVGLLLSTPEFAGARGGMSHASPGRGKSAAPARSGRSSINGGAQRPASATSAATLNRSAGGSGAKTDGGKRGDAQRETNKRGGDRTNINSGNTNVNINVDNSRNTVVRRNTNIHYTRPPYVYGGHRYYCYHPYYYHPYRPYYWGPVWHPWGFFIATLAATAIIVSVENQQYHYDQGVFYVASNGGYTVVAAPVGATVSTIPSNSQTVVVNETTNNYYYGGTYYEKSNGGYTVVPPTAGCVVESLPDGGEEVKIGGQTYVKVGETYYQPIQKDGKDLYEVVNVEEGN